MASEPARHHVSRKSLPWYLRQPIIHRGLHNIHDGVVEHSRTAVERAIAAGLPLEVDIDSSSDHVNFVFHDRHLDNLTDGSGELRRMKARDIRACSLIKTRGEPIMLLEELLDLVRGRVPLMIEYKSRECSITRGVREAARILDRYDGVYGIQSFNPFILEWYRENRPTVPRGLLTTDLDTLQSREQYMIGFLRKRMYPDFCSHQCRQLNNWSFQWVIELQVPIIAFTVRDNEDWNASRKFADNMYFEFIEPDVDDWRVPATDDWRRRTGEQVDRRQHANQPPNLPNDLWKGPTPWFAGRNPLFPERSTPNKDNGEHKGLHRAGGQPVPSRKN